MGSRTAARLFLLLWLCTTAWGGGSRCRAGINPIACFPPYEDNIVAGSVPDASNVCGQEGRERVCHLLGSTGMIAGTCDYCDASDPSSTHPPEHITDEHSTDAITYWQSQNHTVVQYPNSVNITFSFNRTFEVGNIVVTFHSSRPESYIILISTDFGRTYTPLQYYSQSCNITYGLEEGALCSAEEARLAPSSGGQVLLVISPTQEATNVRLKFDRLNTFGDEVITMDPRVLDSYYYAVSNVEIGARCACNGHASGCFDNQCLCEHSTMGPRCEQCRPFYQDQPWSAATPENPSECRVCNCNGHSSECHFDPDIYDASGGVSGGVCDGCQHNTTGVNCERCVEGLFPDPDQPFTSETACIECDCDPRGTVGRLCRLDAADPSDQCPCKNNTESQTCSTCRAGFFGIDASNPDGCSPCNCSMVGTVGGSQLCDAITGQCNCMPNVGQRDCSGCLPGFYNQPGQDSCLTSCNCNPLGSLGMACDSDGRCSCRTGVGGFKCDSCLPNFFGFEGGDGCQECGCDPLGAADPQCDASGQCRCKEGVEGEKCDRCQGGYFNLASNGCSPCPCPGVTPNAQFGSECEEAEGEVVCAGCREGHTGDRCEACEDGYFGDPQGTNTGTPVPCEQCECNGNADPPSCDPIEGSCLRCLFNTSGRQCEVCAPGFYGDAITAKNCTACPPEHYSAGVGGCLPCNCHPNGSLSAECVGGVCECVPGVMGDRCDVCRDGFHQVAQGCLPCPTCYDEIASEFNTTAALYNELLLRVNASSGGLDPELITRLQEYQELLSALLERAINATNQEPGLLRVVESVSMETDTLSDLISQFGANVSTAETETDQLTTQAMESEVQLRDLQQLVDVLMTAIRETALQNLEEARRLSQEILSEFNQLVTLASEANMTSFTQQAISQDLINQASGALNNATMALQLLCDAVALQNTTTQLIDALMQEELPQLEELFRAAREALMNAERDVPLALSEARLALERALNLTIPDYNVDSLQREVGMLRNRTEVLLDSTAAIDSELDRQRGNFSILNSSARILLQESQQLNVEAQDLLAKAHGALSFANTTVTAGNEFIRTVAELLAELQRRLADVDSFIVDLAEVIRNIELAENLSTLAQNEAERSASEVQEAMRQANAAAELLDSASVTLQEALRVATGANTTAASTLSDARTLNSSAADLKTNATLTRDSIDTLEQEVQEDQVAIAIATSAANETISAATSVQNRIAQLQSTLTNLSQELNATLLIPRERLSRVNTTLSTLEEETDGNQALVVALIAEVDRLQQSARQLREQYTLLLQHRDLLQQILGNINRLDCRNQFLGSAGRK